MKTIPATQEQEQTPKQRRTCLTCFVVLAMCVTIPLFAVVGGVFLLFCFPAPALVISEETTRITGPVTADGQIDFFKALEQKMSPPELATDDNGFRIFVRLFGAVSEGISHEFWTRQKYEKLGLDPNVPPTLTFPPTPLKIVEDYYNATEEEPPWAHLPPRTVAQAHAWVQSNIGERPWTLEEFLMFADWIKEIDVPMDAAAETIRKPIFLPPLYHSQESVETGKPQSLFALVLPDVQFFQDIARIFQARAAYRVGQGNIDGAIDDKLTIHRLGRLVAQKSCLVQVLIATRIEEIAAAIPVNANPEHPLTPQQLHRLLDGLNALPPRTSLHDAYEWERHSALSEVQSIGRGAELWGGIQLAGIGTLPDGSVFSYDIDNDPGLWILKFVSVDWNVVYRRLNEIFDALHDPPPRTTLDTLLDRASTNWKPNAWGLRKWAPGGRADILADFFIATTFPAADSAEEMVRRIECADNMQRLTLAILLYQHEHGKLQDENWVAQIKPYLGDGAERYFSCPSHPSPQDKTTYALVQYGEELPVNPDTFLLVELREPVAFSEAIISADKALERKRIGSRHRGGMNAAYRSGAVRFMSEDIEEADLLHSLGQEE